MAIRVNGFDPTLMTGRVDRMEQRDAWRGLVIVCDITSNELRIKRLNQNPVGKRMIERFMGAVHV